MESKLMSTARSLAFGQYLRMAEFCPTRQRASTTHVKNVTVLESRITVDFAFT
jgi:hypothetical protein